MLDNHNYPTTDSSAAQSSHPASQNSELLIYDTKACHSCLDALRGRIGNYDKLFALMRAHAQRTGRMPNRFHDFVKKFINPNRPYFVGKTIDGTRFLGDIRERHAVTTNVMLNHDAYLWQFIRERIKTGQTFLDIGANVGIIAATVARALDNGGEVVAFEPLPNIAEMAACTFALNGLTNARVIRCAVSDKNDDIAFYSAPGHSEWSTTDPTEQAFLKWEKTTVPARTLDDLREDGIFSHVQFIKVDVEGHEPSVFRGAQKVLTRDVPFLLYEYNFDAATKAGWTLEEVSSLLHGLENEARPYRFQILQDGGRIEPVSPASLEKARQSANHVDIYCDTDLSGGHSTVA